jgi:hypothetical protein
LVPTASIGKPCLDLGWGFGMFWVFGVRKLERWKGGKLERWKVRKLESGVQHVRDATFKL